ncbi:MAG: ABC transporter substrate-binding protein, partial [Alphaproteobacteria bacterium]|nr:ABC transporter substrate-binding protein [Alphaproteobacteria bacterium]
MAETRVQPGFLCRWRARSFVLARMAAGFCGVLCASPIGTPTALSADGPGYTVAVHISSSPDNNSGPEEVFAIQDFVKRRAEMINAQGGIKGRPLNIKFFDDKTDVEKTKANVDKALRDPRLLAMVGIWNSTRGSQVMDQVGRSGKALISELSVEDLFSQHRNIYTLTRSVSDEEDVFVSFAQKHFQRLAFIGLDNDLYTRAFYERLSAPDAKVPIVSSLWIKGQVEQQWADVDRTIADIKSKNADVLFLSVGSTRGAKLLQRLAEQNVSIPVFIALGSINGVVTHPTGGGKLYAGAFYEIAEGGIANLNNERLEQLMRSPDRMPAVRSYSPYAVGYGARYADLVAMLAEFAEASPSANPARMADHIVDELAKLRKGQRVWRGWAQDWTFTDARASGEHSLLVWQPPAASKSILAPEQFVRAGGTVHSVPVLYVHLDMVSISHVDSNDRSFEAEFFFTMRAKKQIPISEIEFTNAMRGARAAEPLINVRRVHQETATGPDDLVSRIYKVSGRFRFEPDLRKYPFDQQIFSISFQPATMDAAFFLQPPSDKVRSKSFSVDGWKIASHYVGTNELIIRSIASAAGGEKVLP